MWESLEQFQDINKRNNLLTRYSNFLLNDDIKKSMQSSSLILFPQFANSRKSSPDSYLTGNCKLYIKKLISQIKLLNIYCKRLIYDRKIYSFKNDFNCEFCGIRNTNILHFIVDCKLLYFKRKNYGLIMNQENSSLNINYYLEKPLITDLIIFVNFIKYVLEHGNLQNFVIWT